MDTSSPFFTPVSPVELDKRAQVTFSQLLQHVRSVDQREAFLLKNVMYNSPAPSVASSRRSSVASSRKPSVAASSRKPSVDPARKHSAASARKPSLDPAWDPLVGSSGRCSAASASSRKPSVDPNRKPSMDPSRRHPMDSARKPSVDPNRRPSGDPSRKPSVDPARRPSGDPSRKSSTTPDGSTTSRRAKRSGLILVTDKIKTWSDDEEETSLATAVTGSSISSVRRRSSSGRAMRNKLDNPTARKRSLQSGWWDEETDSEDDESPSIPVLARRVALTPSKRSLENLKGVFDPGFSFSRRCLTTTAESVDPLDTLCTWF